MHAEAGSSARQQKASRSVKKSEQHIVHCPLTWRERATDNTLHGKHAARLRTAEVSCNQSELSWLVQLCLPSVSIGGSFRVQSGQVRFQRTAAAQDGCAERARQRVGARA